ncbi:MAG: [acyl-carrier-protein] S-malonyltransferase [Gammaproteobacteria bacterium]|nr:MAG: [acyl-carrier-protein] S-malonyltransferase [Gammaproteobacteria bacterium]UTW42298.1 ACP S-malonyltransferase [bacterium SCSIO 12844]
MSANSKIAYVFPGQGSQKKAMLSDYYQEFSLVRDTFNEASEALGFDLWNIILNDENRLSQTAYTQPALLAGSIAIYRLLLAKSELKPTLMAGHSLGEYSALVAAGSLDFSDALKLVHLRGQLMQEAVPSDVGAMSAILGLDDQTVIEVCQKASNEGIVTAANFNSPGQVVIAGERNAVINASELAKQSGAKRAQILPVSVPSHCMLMKPAAEKLAEALEKIQLEIPKIPVIHNVDVEIHNHADEIRQALVHQLYSPVKWSKTIQLMAAEGIDVFIELGSGKVLTGLNKRIVKDKHYLASDSVGGFNQVLECLVSL